MMLETGLLQLSEMTYYDSESIWYQWSCTQNYQIAVISSLVDLIIFLMIKQVRI